MTQAELNTTALFWSKRGAVACAEHAPDVTSPQWTSEGWIAIPASADRRHRLAYQCCQCAEDGRPHRRLPLGESGPHDDGRDRVRTPGAVEA
jgi:hypothetical protein